MVIVPTTSLPLSSGSRSGRCSDARRGRHAGATPAVWNRVFKVNATRVMRWGATARRDGSERDHGTDARIIMGNDEAALLRLSYWPLLTTCWMRLRIPVS